MLYNLFVIPERGRKLRTRNILLQAIACIAIWSTLLPALIVFSSVWIYQQIYFTIFDIPKIRAREYIVLDRWKLKKLNIFRKLGCLYCEFANGATAWLKEVANRTELYSCAIQHGTRKNGQEHQEQFQPYERFR